MEEIWRNRYEGNRYRDRDEFNRPDRDRDRERYREEYRDFRNREDRGRYEEPRRFEGPERYEDRGRYDRDRSERERYQNYGPREEEDRGRYFGGAREGRDERERVPEMRWHEVHGRQMWRARGGGEEPERERERWRSQGGPQFNESRLSNTEGYRRNRDEGGYYDDRDRYRNEEDRPSFGERVKEWFGFGERDRDERDRGDWRDDQNRNWGDDGRRMNTGDYDRDRNREWIRPQRSFGDPGEGTQRYANPPYQGQETGFGAARPAIGAAGHFGRGPKGYQRSDERLREEICERLTAHPDIDASDIEIQVNNGEVTLVGSVQSRQTKHLAEDVADGIMGVRDVNNQLRVTQRYDIGGANTRRPDEANPRPGEH